MMCAGFAHLWEPIKMLDADNRTIIAILAESIEIIVRLPFVLLSTLVSPVLHHIGFLSRLMPNVVSNDAQYFFSPYGFVRVD